MIAAINKFRRQLFVKLLFIFFVTGIVLVSLLASGVHYINRDDSNRFSQFEGNVSQYVDYLIADIGQPPRIEKIKQLSQKTGTEIFIEHDSKRWQSAVVDYEKLRDMPYRPLGPAGDVELSRRHSLTVLKKEQQGYRYWFVSDHSHFGRNWMNILFLSILITLVVIGVAYFAVDRLFRPIRQLREASQKIANGDLDATVGASSKDELGDLAESFNIMAANISSLIRSKDQLLLDVSHELRSPLTRIKVAVEMLAEQKYADSINKDIQVLERLISNILESARLRQRGDGKGDIAQGEVVDVQLILQTISDDLKDFAPGIELHSTASFCNVRGDAVQLDVALRNIVENAMKFSDQQTKPVEITINKISDCVCISVRDYGVGIADEDSEKIFEPFVRLDSARNHNKPGFGLGLSISKSIVELHNGHISVCRVDDVITEFFIKIPAAGCGCK